MIKIQEDTRLKRSKGLITTEVDGELVMMSVDKGKYFGLNEIGHAIWQLLDKFSTPAEIISQLQKEYKVDRETCEEDVMDFLQEMAGKGVVDFA